MEHPELKAWLRLTLSPRIGNHAARRLLAEFGSAPAVFEQEPGRLRELGTDKLASSLLQEPPSLAAQLQTTLEWLNAGEDRRIVTLGDPGYPASLLDIEDPPLMLYMLGDQAGQGQTAIHNAACCIAIVGSRNPTPQGEVNARHFAKALGSAGLCVISGLALGIDAAAHDGALLAGAGTIAVVGTGLDRVYPKGNLALAHRIAQQGLIVSEFPLGTPPLTANFPKRNRIISGLAQGVLVVEAALKSGSLITARLAAEQGKEVFAIPGSIHSPQSRGCHLLIKQGAKLVETVEDVLEEMKLPASYRLGNVTTECIETNRGDLNHITGTTGESGALLAALGFEVSSLDALQARTGLSTAELQARLLELELDGHIARLPGGLFQRLASA